MKAVDAIALAQVAGSAPRTIVRTSRADTLRFGNDEGYAVRLEFVVIDRQEPAARVQVLQEADVHQHGFHVGFPFGNHVLVDDQTQIDSRMGQIGGGVLGIAQLDIVGHVERPLRFRVGQDLPRALVRAGDAVQDVGPVGVPVLVAEPVCKTETVHLGIGPESSIPKLGDLLLVVVVVRGPLPPQPVVQPPPLDELHEVVLRDAGGDVATSEDGEVRAPGQREIESDERRLFVPEFGIPELIWWYCDGVQGVQLPLLEERQRWPLRLRLAALLRRLKGAVLRGGARMLRSARREGFYNN